MEQKQDMNEQCETSQSVYPEPRWDAELMSPSEMEEKVQELRLKNQQYLLEISQKTH